MKPLTRVIITGSQGSLGKILQAGLRNSFNLLCIDKISDGGRAAVLDIAVDYEKFKNLLTKEDIIIHLAWDTFEDYPNENIVPQNKIAVENVYKAAVEKKVLRVIIASSVHANDYSTALIDKHITPQLESCPDTPYGATKVYIEHLGRYFSRTYGLGVICLRLGGVNKTNEIRFNEDPLYDRVLLYKEDFLELIRMCIEAKQVPNNFSIFYAVSNMPGRVHSLNNFLNWKPKFPKK